MVRSPVKFKSVDEVVSIPIPGGLHHDYQLMCAWLSAIIFADHCQHKSWISNGLLSEAVSTKCYVKRRYL